MRWIIPSDINAINDANEKTMLALAVFGAVASTRAVAAADILPLLIVSASTAQQRCHGFVHEDADKFVLCIDAIEPPVDRRHTGDVFRRLGIVSFAWVAAHNSARIALPGAEAAVATYFARMRRLQRQTGVGDALLYGTVLGD